MADSLNRVRYAGLDFDTIEDELRARLQVKFASSFNDFSVSSLGVVLLDVFSFGLDTLSFYLDRRATDTYLTTARTRRAVSLLTRQLGYKMHGAVAASVDLSVAAKQLYAFPVPIPKGFQFQTAAGVIFEAAQSVTIPASSTAAVTVPCYQGETVSESFVSDGTANQVFKLSRVPADAFIVEGSVEVYVNGAPFTESEFITFDATDQFEINYNDEPPSLRFGDGVAGNIPVKGGSISVSYVATLGAAGQTLSGGITKEVSPLVVMFQQISITATNLQNTVGGSDLEELEHAKAFAPKVFKSRRVAITRGDYEALAGSYVDPLFGRVAVAQAIAARSSAADIELQNLTAAITANLNAATVTITNAMAASSTGALARTDVIAAAVTALQADLSQLLTKLNAVNTNLTTTQSNSRTIKSQTGEIQADYTDAHTEILTAKNNVTTLYNSINALTTAGTSQLTSGDKTTFLGLLNGYTNSFNKVDALLGLINGLAASAGAAADSTTTIAQTNQETILNEIGVSTGTSGSIVKDINTQLVAAVAQIGTAVFPYSALYLQLQNALSAANLNAASITADLVLIEDHVDKILAADCEANLVVVPILARDAAGYYAAPSNGLIRSVQAYLDGIKEVTQTVKVTSGAGYLVPAAIRVKLGVRIGVSEQIVSASAKTIVDSVLRDRAFGTSLYVSDLVEPLSALSGIAYVNVSILGHRPTGSLTIETGKVDIDGNLIIEDSEVITLSLSDLVVSTTVYSGA